MVVRAAIALLHQKGIQVLTYLDDWLILAAFLEVILGEMKFTRA
uniref:Uncharacterized protein n=1 Tax=Anguilla anguilla TaxID=7936 RepID=A0A0E9TLX1_ANGAN